MSELVVIAFCPPGQGARVRRELARLPAAELLRRAEAVYARCAAPPGPAAPADATAGA